MIAQTQKQKQYDEKFKINNPGAAKIDLELKLTELEEEQKKLSYRH